MAQVTNFFLEGPGPFGFRLYGGRGDPLIISKIRVGSKAFEADLREGDVVKSINGQDCSQMTQSAAMNIIDTTDNSLSLEIIRNDRAGPGTVVSKNTQRSQPVTNSVSSKVSSSSDFVDFRPMNSYRNEARDGYMRQEETKRDGNTTSRTVTETEKYGGTTLTRVTREKTSEWSSGGDDLWKSNTGVMESWNSDSRGSASWKSNAGGTDTWKSSSTVGDYWKPSSGSGDSWRPRSATPREEVLRTTSAGFRPEDKIPANPDRVEMTLDLGRPEDRNFGSNYNLLTSGSRTAGSQNPWTPNRDGSAYSGNRSRPSNGYSTWGGNQAESNSAWSGNNMDRLIVDVAADGSYLKTNSSNTSPLSTSRRSVWTPSKHEPNLLTYDMDNKKFEEPFAASSSNAFIQGNSYSGSSTNKFADDGFTSENILFKWNSGGEQMHQSSPRRREEAFRTTSARVKREPTPVTFDLGRPPLEEFKENRAPASNFTQSSAGRSDPKSWGSSLNGPSTINLEFDPYDSAKKPLLTTSSQQNSLFDESKTSGFGTGSNWKSSNTSSAPRRSDFSYSDPPASTGSLLSPRMSKFDSDKGYVNPLSLDDLDALGKFGLDSDRSVYNVSTNRKMNFPDLPPEINKILSAPRDTVEDPASVVAKQRIKSDGTVEEKKVFADSSFYATSGHNYPTVEEQVKMARIVAHSLTSDANINARGHQMFLKRKERADKYTVDNSASEKKPAIQQQDNFHRDDNPYYNPTPWNPAKSWAPEGTGSGFGPGVIPPPPPLPTSLLFAPRGEDKSKALSAPEFERVRLYDQKSKHDSVSPQVCFNLARDLRENKGKGGKMFAKRRARAEQYTVEGQGQGPDSSIMMKIVTGHARDNPTPRPAPDITSTPPVRPAPDVDYTQAPPVNRLKQMIDMPKPKMTPWDAVAEYGHVDPAFEHLRDVQFFPKNPGKDILSSSIHSKMTTGYESPYAPSGSSAGPSSWARNTSNSINTEFSSRTNTSSGFTPKVDFSSKSNSGYRPVQFSTSISNHTGHGIAVNTGSLGFSEF